MRCLRQILFSWGADFVLKFVYDFCDYRILELKEHPDSLYIRGKISGFEELKDFCSIEYFVRKKKYIRDIK